MTSAEKHQTITESNLDQSSGTVVSHTFTVPSGEIWYVEAIHYVGQNFSSDADGSNQIGSFYQRPSSSASYPAQLGKHTLVSGNFDGKTKARGSQSVGEYVAGGSIEVGFYAQGNSCSVGQLEGRVIARRIL